MRSMLALAVLAFPANGAAAQVLVNCDRGDSLAAALSLLPKNISLTVAVTGTCTEYVEVRGFERLTLKSTTGAVLQQPVVPSGSPDLIRAPLTITASHGVTILGLTIRASSTDPKSWGLLVRGGSADVRVRETAVEGGVIGVGVVASEVSLARVTGRDPNWAAVADFDGAAIHIEDCVFETTRTDGWREGVVADKAVIAMHGTTIRNMQVGIDARDGGIVSFSNFAEYYPTESAAGDVVIENAAGTSYNGLSLANGASAVLGDVKLRIVNPGQAWGGTTGGVVVSDGSAALLAASNSTGGGLEISGSQGQGVVVANNSFATISGATITGSAHAGLVAINGATINLDTWDAPLARITGIGAPDMFCDARSLITGGDKATYGTKQCENLLGGTSVPLP